MLGILLAAFLALECCLPLASAVKIGVDEDFELSKAVLCSTGHRLFTEVWSDQPPLYVSLLTLLQRHEPQSILAPRLLTVMFAAALLASFFLLARATSGTPAAAVATVLLIGSPGFLELSSSAMQEIPALAPAVAALCTLQLWPAERWRSRAVVAGSLLAVAWQMKLIGLVYAPLAVLVPALRMRSAVIAPEARRAGASPREGRRFWIRLGRETGLVATVALAGFLLINGLTGSPLRLQLMQAWQAHFATAQSLEVGAPEEHGFDWTILIKNWDTTLAALVGVAALLRLGWSGKGSRGAWLPLAWLLLTGVVFTTHHPWWGYYYLHNALPLCWCAGVGLTEWGAAAGFHRRWGTPAAAGASGGRGWAWRWSLGWFCALATLWVGSRVVFEVDAARKSPKLFNCLVLREVERFRPFTHLLFTDQPIYSFHSGIPLPPQLGVLSLKRYWTGEMTGARVAAELQAARPELVLLKESNAEVVFQDLLNREYQLVYHDGRDRLYAHRSIARKARYD